MSTTEEKKEPVSPPKVKETEPGPEVKTQGHCESDADTMDTASEVIAAPSKKK